MNQVLPKGAKSRGGKHDDESRNERHRGRHCGTEPGRCSGEGEFEEAWQRKVPSTYGGVPIYVLSIEDLIVNKKAVGRLQDRIDIEKLEELVGEMNRRYTVLKANRVANIFDLHNKSDASERFPFLWILHDEFAEWMMTESYADAVSNIVSRLGVKARAAGISLVFAAQRPDANAD